MFCTLKLDRGIIRQRKKYVCVNTVKMTVLSFFSQNEIPPYESRVTTAKLLLESEEFEVKLCAFFYLCMFPVNRGTWHLCVFVCACVDMNVLLVNISEGGKAMLGLYPFQSSVSIIEEWYLQRGTEVRGSTGGRM